MEERKQNNRRSEAQKPKEKLSPVTVIQIVLCVLLSAFFGVFGSGETEFALSLKKDFSSLLSLESIKSDSAGLSAVFRDFLTKPVQLFPAFSPPESETEAASQKSEGNTAEESEAAAESETAKETETDLEEAGQGSAKQRESAEETLLPPANGSSSQQSAFLSLGRRNSADPSFSGSVESPVNSTRYTSLFGDRVNPITGEEGFHTGLDIAAGEGTKIRAADTGRVIKTGEDSRSGKYIFLSHSDGYETFYCHCSEISAPEGANIRRGETIALVGSTGWSTGPHLHFEIHKNGKRLDPLPFIEKK